MYVLTYNIHERSGQYTGDTSDEAFDRLCTLMCNHYDNYNFDNKVVDMRYRIVGRKHQFEKYEETCDIIHEFGQKVGHYTLRLI